MGLFSKKEKSQTCEDCGTTFMGLVDKYSCCGTCLGKRIKQAAPKSAKKMTGALDARAAYMMKHHG